jgi:hypothetical protein
VAGQRGWSGGGDESATVTRYVGISLQAWRRRDFWGRRTCEVVGRSHVRFIGPERREAVGRGK